MHVSPQCAPGCPNATRRTPLMPPSASPVQSIEKIEPWPTRLGLFHEHSIRERANSQPELLRQGGTSVADPHARPYPYATIIIPYRTPARVIAARTIRWFDDIGRRRCVVPGLRSRAPDNGTDGKPAENSGRDCSTIARLNRLQRSGETDSGYGRAQTKNIRFMACPLSESLSGNLHNPCTFPPSKRRKEGGASVTDVPVGSIASIFLLPNSNQKGDIADRQLRANSGSSPV